MYRTILQKIYRNIARLTRKKIRVIYNGVSDSYHPLDGILSEKSQDVVFVGARSGYKNFTLAVESVASVPNLQLKSWVVASLVKMK